MKIKKRQGAIEIQVGLFRLDIFRCPTWEFGNQYIGCDWWHWYIPLLKIVVRFDKAPF